MESNNHEECTCEHTLKVMAGVVSLFAVLTLSMLFVIVYRQSVIMDLQKTMWVQDEHGYLRAARVTNIKSGQIITHENSRTPAVP